MKLAIIHDWLIGMRGGEKVLEEVLRLFPESEIFTLFYIPRNVSPSIRCHRVHDSWLAGIPGALKHYRHFLPLFPSAVNDWDFKGFDAVLSISHCAAKGATLNVPIPHICYCLTPMRYVWDNFDAYFAPGRAPSHIRLAMKMVRPFLKCWDVRSTARVDRIIGISEFVAERIRSYYHREPAVIYPPVDTEFFTLPDEPGRDDFYLMVCALVPYKKIDMAIEAFNNNKNKELKIVGMGPELQRLQRLAVSGNIDFLGYIGEEALRSLYQRAKALVYCGEEDFGIAMVEAQACGTPVVAYARGGALEIVRDGESGILYEQSDSACLTEALEKLENRNFTRHSIRERVLKFGVRRFRNEFFACIHGAIEKSVT